MPIYCYICECGKRWESFSFTSKDQDSSCPECGSGRISRDYPKEKITFIPDIEPYHDFSIGMDVTGRRDRATKYKALGVRPLHGANGGDSVKPFKEFYSDEIMAKRNESKENPIDVELKQAMASGVEGDVT